METCNKKIKHSMRDVGVIAVTKCSKPIFKDGMCKKHYNNKLRKLINWGDRKEYEDATQEHLDFKRSLKLKNVNVNRLFKCNNNIIEEYNPKTNKYIKTDIEPDFNLFCVKKI